jgi:CubicO group peptidase (beta-lactamase class C family)
VAISIFCSCKKDSVKKLQTDNQQITDLDKQVHSILTDYFQKSSSVGASLAFINNDNLTFYNYGETQKGNNTLPDNKTLYEIGSVTKVFTSLASQIWLGKHNLSFTTAVKNYLPATVQNKFSQNGKDVKLIDILRHVSGIQQLPTGFPANADPYKLYDSTAIYNYIQNNTILVKDPGTMPMTVTEAYNNYSNLAYAIPGLIIERNEKVPLQSYFTNNIFQPLGMINTTFNDIESAANIAHPHDNNGVVSYWHLNAFKSAGGLKSNTDDLTKFAKAAINAVPNDPNATLLNNAFVFSNSQGVAAENTLIFGYGWEFYKMTNGEYVTVKDGGTGGFTAYVAISTTSKKGIVALFNNNSSNKTNEVFIRLLNTYFK